MWRVVVAINAVIMTVFPWHTTALLAVVGVFEATGIGLVEAPTLTWWALRPLFIVVPAAFVIPLVMLFGRFEISPLTRG